MSYAYKFNLKTSNPKVEGLDKLFDQEANFWQRVYMKDSMNAYFPYLEVIIADFTTIVSEVVFFVEGIELTAKLVKNSEEPNEEILEHDFFWSEHQMQNPRGEGKITGDTLLLFLSRHRKDDLPKSRSFNGTIESVIQQVAATQKSSFSKTVISATGNNDYWYQTNERDSQFVQMLGETAFSQSSDQSPFYAFINLQNEFYFSTVEDLFKQQPVETFKLIKHQVEEGFTQVVPTPTTIMHFEFMYGGFPTNSLNYNRRIFNTDTNGDPLFEDSKLENHLTRTTNKNSTRKGKFTLRSQDIPKNASGISYYGIKNSTDSDNFKGYRNNLCRDSALAYRMTIRLPYNDKIAAGRIIRTEIDSYDEGKAGGLSPEYSGDWVVLESEVLFGVTGQPWTQAVIAKSTIDLNQNHIFFNDFI